MENSDIKIVTVGQSRDGKNNFDITCPDGGSYPREEIIDKLDSNKKNYILFHFGEINTGEQFLKEKIKLEKKIRRESDKTIFILPISMGCIGFAPNDKHCRMANDLYKKIEEIQKSSNPLEILNPFIKFWCEEDPKVIENVSKQIDTEKKKEVVFSVLPFCIYCENVYKFKTINNNKDKIQQELKEIKNKIEGSVGKDDGWDTEFSSQKGNWDMLLKLLNEKDIKLDEVREFIGINDNGEKKISDIEETKWWQFLKDLKIWAYSE